MNTTAAAAMMRGQCPAATVGGRQRPRWVPARDGPLMIRRRTLAEMVSIMSTVAIVRKSTVPARGEIAESQLRDEFGADAAGADDAQQPPMPGC